MSEVRGRKTEVGNQAALTTDFRLPTPDLRPPISDFRLPTSGFRRPAATLLEVLVAIFIMGIGMIALLVLFPLGALTMAQAIQRDRAAHAAISASAIANVADVRRDLFVYDPVNFDLFLNPKRPAVAPFLPTVEPPAGVFPNADLEKKSYPVLIDSVGYFTASGLTSQYSVGGLLPPAQPLLLRRAHSSIAPFGGAEVYRWFTFQDDIIFDKAGNAKITAATVPPLIERDVRYSAAYLMQRPRTADPSVVDLTVVVYDSRPLGLAGNLDLPEFPYYLYDAPTKTPEVVFYPATNGVTIWYGPPFNKNAPPIRSGDWILDVSVYAGEPHAYFYRVAGVTDTGTALEIETQQPLRGFGGAAAVDSSAGARLLFLEGVAEVFERGLGKEPSRNP